MLPSILQPHEPCDVPAPPGFRPAGRVRNALIERNLVDFEARGNSFAQKAGLRYEGKVQRALQSLYPNSYTAKPWISFEDETGWRRCQPDGLLLDADANGLSLAVVVEVKVRHLSTAWWQLRKLYQPVIENAFPKRKVQVVEICGSFDPSEPFPEEHIMISGIRGLLERIDKIGVLEWKP